MKYTGVVKRENKKQLLIELDELINENYKALISENKPLRVEVEIKDNRLISAEQRKLIYSLIRDIAIFTGYDVQEVKALVKLNYEIEHNVDAISFSDCEKQQANEIIKYLIDVVLQLGVPLSERYKYLLEDNYFFYKCLKNRVCCICGKRNADIAHVETVGMGRDRQIIDHTKHKFMSLCREHHIEQHKIGIKSFIKKYHILTVNVSDEDVVYLGLISNLKQQNFKNE